MKTKRKYMGLVVVILAIFLLFGSCVLWGDKLMNLKSSVSGLSMIVKTYDESSNVIDYIKGKSIDIKAAKEFDATDSEGLVTSKSQVLNITIGGKEMYHVGSSLIAYDGALVDYIEEFPETIEVTSANRSIPFLSRIYNDIKSVTTGKKMIILIRSQSGTPLATFMGDNISIDSTDIDKSTSVYIDGKRLFIYRCDYTIYETSLIE